MCAGKLITSTRLLKFVLARGVNIYCLPSQENKQKYSECRKVEQVLSGSDHKKQIDLPTAQTSSGWCHVNADTWRQNSLQRWSLKVALLSSCRNIIAQLINLSIIFKLETIERKRENGTRRICFNTKVPFLNFFPLREEWTMAPAEHTCRHRFRRGPSVWRWMQDISLYI